MKQFENDRVLQRLAEHRIEQAMREGKFDNLPGAGEPVDLDDMPVDENARMIWWALKLVRGVDSKRRAADAPVVGVGRCTNPMCGNRNPPEARYCRRCGGRVVV
jgi:hypothetical protein